MNYKKPAKNNLMDELIAEVMKESMENPVECVCVDVPAEMDADTADAVKEMIENVSTGLAENFPEKKDNERKRINTTAMFDNTGYFEGGTSSEETHLNNYNISIAPAIEDRYDYSVSEDIVLLEERKATSELIYEIFNNAPFANFYRDLSTGIIKIPKDDIQRVFYYIKDRLLKKKRISAYETVIAINEFFDFDYNYIVKKVLSAKMTAEILDDYYTNMGMKDRIDEQCAEPLF